MSLRYSAKGEERGKFGQSKQVERVGRLTLGTGLDQDTQVSLPLVEGLGTLPQTTSETVVNESVL